MKSELKNKKPYALHRLSYLLQRVFFPIASFIITYPLYGAWYNRLLLRSKLCRWYFVTKDGRVRLWRLETYMAYGCNLDCPYCSQLSPYQKGIVSATKATEMFETWGKLIAPRIVGLQGGEPLLNKELDKIILMTRRVWPKAQIQIVTNGLLLPHANTLILQAAKNVNAHFIVSKHFNEPEYNEKLAKGVSRLEAMGIFHSVRPSYSSWHKYHQIDADGNPKPYSSDYCKVWKKCNAKNHMGLVDNQLYPCGLFGNLVRSLKTGAIGKGWEHVLNYYPLTPESTIDEILEKIYSGAFKECSVCPDKHEVVPFTEIKGIRLMKREREKSTA